MPASKRLLALLAGASICVACGGVFVGHKAVQSAEMFKAEALAWHGKTLELQRRLEASQEIRAELEAKLKAKPATAPTVGKAGTLSRAASNYVNVKTPNGRPNYWKGQVGKSRMEPAGWSNRTPQLRPQVWAEHGGGHREEVQHLQP